jgi:U6 snRNA-associated Sm-like protein LSm2
VGETVVVELKNDLEIIGTLVSVDQFLNIKLDEIKVKEEVKFPYMVSALHFLIIQMAVKNCFIRGSVVRYVSLPAAKVDTALLQDAARREAEQPR